MTFGHIKTVIAKSALALAIVALVFALVYDPHSQEESEESKSTTEEALVTEAKDVPYEIVVNAGSYMPGTMVYGRVGPLKGYREVADEFEALFPDTKIRLRLFPTDRPWIITQQLGDTAPDIMEMNTGDVWQDVDKGWYVPLTTYLDEPNPFVEGGEPGSEHWWDMFEYNEFSRSLIHADKEYYVVVFDMTCAALYYNQDIFEELQIQEPRNWQEFLRNQQRFKDAGYTPMGLGLSWAVSDWVLDFVFDQVYNGIYEGINIYHDPTRGMFFDWNEIVLLHEKGFFTSDDPRWIEMWRLIKQWRKYWNKSLDSSAVELFLNKKAATIWELSSLSLLFSLDEEMDFGWGVRYMPPMTEQTSPYCTGVSPCVVSGARAQLCVTKTAFSDTGNKATSERLKRVIAFLQFITLPRNYARIVNEAQICLPNIEGVEVPPHLEEFERIAKNRLFPTKWQFTFDHRFSDILQRMTNLYIEDGMTDQEFLAWIDSAMEMGVDAAKLKENLNMDEMKKGWRRLAPIREDYDGLPTKARETPHD